MSTPEHGADLDRYPDLSLSHFPKVSVLIATFNRRTTLEKTLDRAVAQRYPNMEILVVDDKSTDGTAEMLQARPGIVPIILKQNVGPAQSRNIGQSLASGDFILNLDDDSWLESDTSLTEIIRRMIAEPEIGVFALNIRLRNNQQTWPSELQPFEVPYYTGCANVYRASVLTRVAGYVSEYFYIGEESERSMRIYDQGYKIVALPHIFVFHAVSPLNRNQERIDRLDIRNAILRELINAPLLLLPFAVCRSLVSGIRLIGLNPSLKVLADIGSSKEIRQMLLRKRRAMSYARYIAWKIMVLSHAARPNDTGTRHGAEMVRGADTNKSA